MFSIEVIMEISVQQHFERSKYLHRCPTNISSSIGRGQLTSLQYIAKWSLESCSSRNSSEVRQNLSKRNHNWVSTLWGGWYYWLPDYRC